MKPLHLILLFLFNGLCTSIIGQTLDPKLEYETTSLAFTKGKTGFLIDSIAISTSLFPEPYGFSFSEDTVFVDLPIFPPYDQLTIETFAAGQPFKSQSCWIDGPYADIRLSIDAGRTRIDAIDYSYVNIWYQNTVARIQQIKNLDELKKFLMWEGIAQSGNLTSAKFLTTFFELPNLTRADLRELKRRVAELFPVRIIRHPWLNPVRQKIKLATSSLPGPLNRFPLRNLTGETIRLRRPTTEYYVLNMYRHSDPLSQQQHEKIQQIYQQDSLFQFAPLVSIDTDESTSLWHLYVKEGDFSWPHFQDDFSKGKPLVSHLKYEGNPYFLLINDKDRIEGVYDNLERLLAAILYRQQLKSNKL